MVFYVYVCIYSFIMLLLATVAGEVKLDELLVIMWAAKAFISTFYSNKQIWITQTDWNINIIRFIDIYS